MIDLTISCCPLNTSLHIQSLKFTSAPWSNIPTKQLHNFKHTILWNTPSMPFYEVRHFMKQAKHAIFWSAQMFWSTLITPFYEAGQARQARQFFEARQSLHFMKHAQHVRVLKHAKHAIFWNIPSTPSTPFYEAPQARKHDKHAST